MNWYTTARTTTAKSPSISELLDEYEAVATRSET